VREQQLVKGLALLLEIRSAVLSDAQWEFELVESWVALLEFQLERKSDLVLETPLDAP